MYYISQVAYDELVLDKYDRNTTELEKLIKRSFVHVQARFCHPSLGMKIQINIQDIVHMEGVHLPYKHGEELVPTFKTWYKKLLDDDEAGLVSFMLTGWAGGQSHVSGPCNFGADNRFNVHGASAYDLRSYRAILFASFVS